MATAIRRQHGDERDLSPRQQLCPQPMSSAQVLLKKLAGWGLDTAFGIPGGTISSVYTALRQVPEIRHIAMRHECAAAFAAVGYARATGKPALVLTTSGPGITNTFSGLATADAEQLPLILLSGEVAASAQGRGAIQDGSTGALSVEAALAPLCRWTGTLRHPDNVASMATQLWSAAMGAIPGAAAMTVPIDLGGQPGRDIELTPQLPAERAARRTDCIEAAALLAYAKNPLLIIGNGARSAHQELLLLAERLRLPVIVTGHGKGTFPERHPLYVGIMGIGQHPSVPQQLHQPPDVTLIVGSRLNDLTTNGWSLPISGSVATLQIDRDPALLGCNARLTHALIGDARLTVRAMLDALPPEQPTPNRRIIRCRMRDEPPRSNPGEQRHNGHERGRSELNGMRTPRAAGSSRHENRSSSGDLSIKPRELLQTLQQRFPEARWVSDIGEHMAHALHTLRVDSPEQFTTFLGYGSMGSGVCGAIGMKQARPRERVICVCGDGGFSTYQAEIMSCVENEIGVVFVVFNDGRWNMVEHGFEAVYGARPVPLIHKVADFATIAQCMGANAVTVSTLAELQQLPLDELVSDTVPLVINALIDARPSLTRETRSASLKHFHGGLDG